MSKKTFEEIKELALQNPDVAMFHIKKLEKEEQKELMQIIWSNTPDDEKLKEIRRYNREMQDEHMAIRLDMYDSNEACEILKKYTKLLAKEILVAQERGHNIENYIQESLTHFGLEINEFVFKSNYIFLLKQAYDMYFEEEEAQLSAILNSEE